MKRFLFFSLVICPVSVFAQGGLPDKPYIYVEGKAEIEKPADIITLRFELVGRAPQQPKANEDVQTKANKIFALIKDRKVADSDVIAEDIRSEPEFEKGDDYGLRFHPCRFRKSKEASSGGEISRPAKAEVERVIVTPQYRFAPVRVTQRVHVIYLISPGK